MTTVDKRLALTTTPNSFLNRLFFQARNLAIEAMLLRLDTALLRQGFNVRSVWCESSFGGSATVEVRLYNTKPDSWEYATCSLMIKREIITVASDISECSACYYTLTRVSTTEHWPARQVKHVLDFRAAVQKMADEGLLASEVMKVNYPFEYERNSSF